MAWTTDKLRPRYNDCDKDAMFGRWEWECPVCSTKGHVLMKQQLGRLICSECGRVWVRVKATEKYRSEESSAVTPKLKLLMGED